MLCVRCFVSPVKLFLMRLCVCVCVFVYFSVGCKAVGVSDVSLSAGARREAL